MIKILSACLPLCGTIFKSFLTDASRLFEFLCVKSFYNNWDYLLEQIGYVNLFIDGSKFFSWVFMLLALIHLASAYDHLYSMWSFNYFWLESVIRLLFAFYVTYSYLFRIGLEAKVG